MPESNHKHLVFLTRTSPFGPGLKAGGFDLMLTAAAFDQQISVVYTDEGIYHLLKEQDSDQIGLKNTSKALPSLELYEIEKVYVEQQALEAYGLKQADLLIPVQLITSTDLANLLEQADQVFVS